MNIGGIEIQINRKHIKNMHLYVKPPDGHVEVSAPLSISEKSIEILSVPACRGLGGSKRFLLNSRVKQSVNMFQVKRFIFGDKNIFYK